MLETIETAVYEGKIICGFPTREECKNYVKGYRTDIDPFDVQLKTQYITEYKPTGCFDR